jgi:hypothetical protein
VSVSWPEVAIGVVDHIRGVGDKHVYRSDVTGGHDRSVRHYLALKRLSVVGTAYSLIDGGNSAIATVEQLKKAPASQTALRLCLIDAPIGSGCICQPGV